MNKSKKNWFSIGRQKEGKNIKKIKNKYIYQKSLQLTYSFRHLKAKKMHLR